MAAFTPSAMKRVAAEANAWFSVGIPLSGVGAMFEGIKNMAKRPVAIPPRSSLLLRRVSKLQNAHRKRPDRVYWDPRADWRRFRERAETRRGGGRYLRAIFAGRGDRQRSDHSNGGSLADSEASLMLER
jgi:hypothetical protein